MRRKFPASWWAVLPGMLATSPAAVAAVGEMPSLVHDIGIDFVVMNRIHNVERHRQRKDGKKILI